jgi:hypothetical protein
MVTSFRRVAALAAFISLPIAGCANADVGPGPDSRILAALPADAPPGECYARVVVPGEPVGPPPVAQGARWVLSPGPAGSPGPIWCLVPTGPVAGPPPQPIARYGWIRVLCDRDATPARIGRIQRQLYERGYYRGEVSGDYDRATAEALARFQAGAHINDGGYLSLETLQALDGAPANSGPPPVGRDRPSPPAGYARAYASPPPGPYAYPAPLPAAPPCGCLAGYAAAPPPAYYYQQSYAAPCCAAASYGYGAYGYSAGYGGGYGFGAPVPAYAAASALAYAGGAHASARAGVRRSVVQNGWLTWDGKSGD